MEYTVIGQARFFMEGGSEEYQSDILQWRGRLWFVANRLLSIATNTSVPAEIIPLEKLDPGHLQGGYFQIGILLPTGLDEYPMAEELRLRMAAVDLALGTSGSRTRGGIH